MTPTTKFGVKDQRSVKPFASAIFALAEREFRLSMSIFRFKGAAEWENNGIYLICQGHWYLKGLKGQD